MKAFSLLIFIPSLIAADISCQDGKTTCPEEKQCCQSDGEYSCCDAEDGHQDVPDTRLKVYPGVEVMSSVAFENASYSVNESTLQFGMMCNLFCSGTCCEEGCCSYSRATCCGGEKCCPSMSKCCKEGCCPSSSTCCSGNRCCPGATTCCRVGCCPRMYSCCGRGCCVVGYKCCGSWCCEEGQECGSSHQTCTSKATAISTDIVVLLLLVVTVSLSRRL